METSRKLHIQSVIQVKLSESFLFGVIPFYFHVTVIFSTSGLSPLPEVYRDQGFSYFSHSKIKLVAVSG